MRTCKPRSSTRSRSTAARSTPRRCRTTTNHDQPAHLTLVKTVTNDDGGAALPAAWTLSATGPSSLSGAGGASGDVKAGSYTLSETAGPNGYLAGAWSCTNEVSVSQTN